MELTYTICPHCNKRIYERQCGNCKYFIQHYLKDGLSFIKINAGHCTASRQCKNKRMLDAACDQWESNGTVGIVKQGEGRNEDDTDDYHC